ncbi:L,D-transpeptidase [Tumebacillus permanentifrigoris]|uniref:L,D-transpeptidase-like protein n=1 Tax=Tumebacillus permanentifrigoris TaxID=378543 RepID=A0A316D4Q6_9BACL|nr:L,D-transpeptidase [Tumebacillus permanentifrigoris]PWK06954.1 L,D-transpeptidase-like protein [Tumebacillus permanentifrigoris]
MKKALFPTTLLSVLLLVGCGSNEVRNTTLQAEAQPSTPTLEETLPQSQSTREPEATRSLEPIDFRKVVIECDISEQRVYVKQDGHVVRTMLTSSGLDTTPDNSTPRGDFQIEPERGEWFYSNAYQEGAQYWVSFKNHGEFLFHSVVMDQNRQIIDSEWQKLGHKASHGCFRLSLPDAKWIYDHIKTGTQVSIHE